MSEQHLPALFCVLAAYFAASGLLFLLRARRWARVAREAADVAACFASSAMKHAGDANRARMGASIERACAEEIVMHTQESPTKAEGK